jgi:hypothetical protein
VGAATSDDIEMDAELTPYCDDVKKPLPPFDAAP